MGVREGFREDGEAVARVTALFDRLSANARPYLPRWRGLKERIKTDIEADRDLEGNADLMTMWVAGKMQGAQDAMRAVLGHDSVYFHDEPGPTRPEFGEEPNPDWWRQYFPEKS